MAHWVVSSSTEASLAVVGDLSRLPHAPVDTTTTRFPNTFSFSSHQVGLSYLSQPWKPVDSDMNIAFAAQVMIGLLSYGMPEGSWSLL
jgi:hypothetical protein